MKTDSLIIISLLIVAATLSCNTTDVPLADRYPLSSKDSKPEGVTFDPVDRAFYAGSLEGGTITRVDADGKETIFFQSDREVSFSGMKVDARSRRLWVCASFRDTAVPLGEEGSLYTEIWIFDLGNGEKTHTYTLPAIAPNARCNDFNLDENGIGYFPDSQKPNIYRIDPDEESGTLYVDNNPILEPPLLLPENIRFFVPGSNGVALTPDQRYLLIANTQANTLFRVSLSDPSDIIEVALYGDDFTAPDGLVMFNSQTLYAVSSVKIHQATFTGTAFDEAVVQSIDFVGGTTTGTLAENQLYVIKSLVKADDESDFPLIIKVDLSLFDEI